MSKFRKGLMKRVIAVVLSCTMIMSGNMTAFASEAPTDTGGYVEEVADEVSRDDDMERESADKEEAETNADAESATEDAAAEETIKGEDNVSDGKGDTDNETTVNVEIVAETDAEVSEEEQASRMESDSSTEKIETESEEKKSDSEDLKEVVKDPDYKAPTAGSTKWNKYADIFEPTVFGGSVTPDTTNNVLGKDATGNMRVAVLNNKGKITADTDGRTMYYYKINTTDTFELSATATINDIAAHNQAGFGLMVRDDMYIDTVNKGSLTDYAVAGALADSIKYNFCRKDGVLDSADSSTIKEKVSAGGIYKLSISYDGSKYICKFGKEGAEDYTTERTLDLACNDKDNRYVGMFAARNADITYSDICLKVGGKVVFNQADQVIETYPITIDSDENGSAQASAVEAIEGAIVTLTATPNKGYCFKEWQVQTGDGLTSVTIAKDQFTMPKGAVSIKAIFKELPTEWSFRKEGGLMKGSGKELNQVSGAVINLEGLVIDTTPKGAKFHTDRDNGAQINNGTIIKVPILGPSRVTIEGYNIYTSYTIDGVQNEDYVQTQTFVCDGTKDYATFVMLPELPWRESDGKPESDERGGEYLYSIKVETINEDEKPRTVWDFQNDDTIAGRAIKDADNQITGYEGNGIEINGTIETVAGLRIDATTGKWDSRDSLTNGWVQVNNGTKITVPVEGACKVAIVAYDANYKVNDEAAQNATQKFTYKGDEKQVVITMTANSYIRSIKVEPLVYVTEGLKDFAQIGVDAGLKENDIPSIDGISFDKMVWHDNQHGLLTKGAGGSLTLSLSKDANITVTTCSAFGTTTNATVSASSGTVSDPTLLPEGTDGYEFNITNAKAGDLKLTISDGTYVHSIFVEYLQEIVTPSGPRKTDVWDFGGKVETDAEKYTNNITPKWWLDSDLLIPATENESKKGRFRGGNRQSYTQDIGDLTIYYVGEDRLYSDLSELSGIVAGSSGNGSNNQYEDGYKAAGGWYGNGSGSSSSDLTKADTRNMIINNVLAGDKIVLYAGQHMADNETDSFGPIVYHFEGQGMAAGQDDSLSTDSTGRIYKKFVFIAEKSGNYKIWPECASKGKPMYNRVMRIPGVKVSGTINFGSFDVGTDYVVKFINQTTKQESVVDVNENGSFEISLASGYTYMAVLSNAPGYDFASAGKTVTIAENSTGESVNLVIEETDRYDYNGNITGFEDGYDISRLTITMVPPEDSTANEVELTINKETKSFAAQLDSGVEYTFRMEGADDYVVKKPEKVQGNSTITEDIVVEPKPKYPVSGGFIGLEDATLTELKFTLLDSKGNPDKNYVYKANITSSSYSIELRDGAYLANATVDGYSTQTHIVVEGKAVSKDLFFVSKTNTPLERVPDLYVGYPNKGSANYKTVSAAVKAAKRMNPQSEEERITIHIAPGTYREQIIVEASYITFTNDEAPEKVILTWYYGVGYEYYSIGNGGFYNEEKAHDKYEKNEVGSGRWGCTVQVKGLDFKAENIIFENSFNRYLTEEELEDGVTPVDQGKDTKPVRDRSLDVSSKAATERAAVLFIENCKTQDSSGNEIRLNRAEFYKCTFLSSQDTVGTGSGNVYSYFKDCVIEGNTDYICGDGDAVFDNCELRFGGYTGETGAGGYITAAKTPIYKGTKIVDGKEVPDYGFGYVFWNCTITGADALDSKFIVEPGYLGRPWGAKAASVTFMNTKLQRPDIIIPVGWNEMQNTNPKDANFKEYGTVLRDGTPADTSGRTENTVRTEQPIESMNVCFGDWKWTPTYADYDESKVVKAPVSSEKRTDVPKGTMITLSCATEGADIYYTMDGTDPTGKDSELYKDEISLGNEEKEVTIKAFAKKGEVTSKIVTFTYQVKDASNLIKAPKANVDSGEVDKGTEVSLKCDTEGADIYYTTDGTDPEVKAAMLYRGQVIVIDKEMTIKAIAEKDGNISQPSIYTYTIKNIVVEPEIVAPPTESPASGSTLPKNSIVTLNYEEGVEVYYTINGDDPKTKGIPYDKKTGILLGSDPKTIIVRAIAKKGTVYSEIVEFTYIISADIDPDKFVYPPKFSAPEGVVEKGKKITIDCDTVDAVIYYTTDGTEPKVEEQFLYVKGTEIAIDKTMTIRAIAEKNGNLSAESKAVYKIEETEKPPVNPDIPVEPDDPGSTKPDAKDIWITGLEKSYPYTGAKIIPDIKVWDCDVKGADRLLTPGVDYTVTYKNNVKSTDDKTTEDKMPTVIVTGKGNYFGKDVTETFRIAYVAEVTDEKAISVKGAKIELVEKKYAPTYDGTQKNPAFKLVFKGKTPVTYEYEYNLETGKYVRLDNDKEMNVNIAVSNNVSKGTATILVSGKKEKNKVTSVKATFKILPVDLSKAAVEVKAGAGVYAVKGAVPESLTVTCGGKTLVNGIDYTVKYGNNKNAGNQVGTIAITGKGNYTKKASTNVKFDIKPLDLSEISVSAVTACEGITPGKIKATVVDGDGNALKPSQYKLTIYQADKTTAYGAKDRTKLTADTEIYVEATAAEKEKNLTGTTKKECFKVGKDISKAKFKLKKGLAKEYTGAEVKLTKEDFESVTYKDKSGTSNLTLDAEYEIIEYSNNINKGTATAVIRGKGSYSGTKIIKFKIKQKKMVKGSESTTNK